MPELVLPGVYIDVRAEALIVGGPISVGNIGIVGTARQGRVETVEILSSYADARATFGSYDDFDKPETEGKQLTLVRALELAYANGASTVLAVRVASSAAKAAFLVAAGTGVTLTAKTPGAWGNNIQLIVVDAPSDTVIVTVKGGTTEETYTVATGTQLRDQINNPRTGSALVDATPLTGDGGGKPTLVPATPTPKMLANGANGATTEPTDYKRGFDLLLNEDAHIIVAAGLGITQIGATLKAHVEQASTDKIKHDRIAIVGSQEKASNKDASAFTSDRVIFVTPGVKTTDAAKAAAQAVDTSVTLPGAYTAAAIAGMLSARDPHISLTNKTLSVGKLEVKFTSGELEQFVKNGVLALEDRRGIRVVRAVTTDLGAFQQITTRRIVDFAKFGVRASADPFIGLLNNDRVRKALKGSINGFLAGMVDDEMVVSYELDVTATRDQQIRGICQVTMTLRPTFSIDFIKVVMFLG